jgi:prophage antirepressor-like protein
MSTHNSTGGTEHRDVVGYVRPEDLLLLEIDDIEVQIIPDGKGSFVVIADGLAKALGHGSTKDLTRYVSTEHKGGLIVPTLGGPQRKTVIDERGFWEALGRSRSDRAKPIQERMYGEIMPQIFRTGRYAPELTKAERYLETFKMLVADAEEERRLRELAEARADREKSLRQASAADAAYGVEIAKKDDEVTLTTACKTLRLISRGPNSVKAWLTREGHLTKKGEPAAGMLDAKRLVMRRVTFPVKLRSGETKERTEIRMFVTPKGEHWLSANAPAECRKGGEVLAMEPRQSSIPPATMAPVERDGGRP